jgi:DNA-binding FadR family transcriptional regulator
MNPTAAAARRITAGQIEAMEKLGKEEQQRIIGTILANPEDFADLARKIASGADPKLLTTMLKNFLSAANRTMQYELRVGDESDQTGEMLLDAVDTVMPQ